MRSDVIRQLIGAEVMFINEHFKSNFNTVVASAIVFKKSVKGGHHV